MYLLPYLPLNKVEICSAKSVQEVKDTDSTLSKFFSWETKKKNLGEILKSMQVIYTKLFLNLLK